MPICFEERGPLALDEGHCFPTATAPMSINASGSLKSNVSLWHSKLDAERDISPCFGLLNPNSSTVFKTIILAPFWTAHNIETECKLILLVNIVFQNDI